jgi:hypothetical protein
MRRVTVDEVLKAYEETGLRAMTGEYLAEVGGERCGCALGAVKLQIANGITSTDPFELLVSPEDVTLEEEVQRRLGITREYEEGFTAGFDGSTWEMCKTHGQFDTAGFYLGYTDGRDAAKVIRPEDQFEIEAENEDGYFVF